MFQTTITAFNVTLSVGTDRRPLETVGADYTFQGVIQPATPEMIESLPEGERTDAAKLIHSTTELFMGGVGKTVQSYVRYNGDVWKVTPKGKWGNFYRYICPKINRRITHA
jgi:hypothetical protein